MKNVNEGWEKRKLRNNNKNNWDKRGYNKGKKISILYGKQQRQIESGERWRKKEWKDRKRGAEIKKKKDE